jgi:hypothetical protein
MSELLLKAKQNLDVAHHLLQNKKHFAPVVHCSYYMCIQLMIQGIMADGMTEEQIREEINKNKGASHNYYINSIFKKIVAKKDLALATRFNNKIKDLKAFREQSDYMNVSIDEQKAIDSFLTSLEIKDIFRSALNIKI